MGEIDRLENENKKLNLAINRQDIVIKQNEKELDLIGKVRHFLYPHFRN